MTVDADSPGFYHCISRCVRRAWLCGDDPLSGRNFDHRRAWIEQRLLDLAESFSVDLYAWAVMSNHTHVVLRIDPALPASWSDEEVAFRWARLSRTLEAVPPSVLVGRVRTLVSNPQRLAELRRRLGDLSWFMRFLNEAIARAANAEDDCTGRFWEGRFKCQALLDEQAVLACMTYVDLNPIRAGIADDLAGSDFTTIQRRVTSVTSAEIPKDEPLRPMACVGTPDGALPVSTAGYIQLVEWTARLARPNTSGRSSVDTPSALESIRGSPDWWVGSTLRVEQVFGSAVGNPVSLREYAARTGRQWVRGL